MAKEPYPLVEVAPEVYVRQIRAVWASADGQTHIRVDNHCTIVTTARVESVVRLWTEAKR